MYVYFIVLFLDSVFLWSYFSGNLLFFDCIILEFLWFLKKGIRLKQCAALSLKVTGRTNWKVGQIRQSGTVEQIATDKQLEWNSKLCRGDWPKQGWCRWNCWNKRWRWRWRLGWWLPVFSCSVVVVVADCCHFFSLSSFVSSWSGDRVVILAVVVVVVLMVVFDVALLTVAGVVVVLVAVAACDGNGKCCHTQFPQTSPENDFLARAGDIKEHLCNLLICWHETCGSIQKKYI